MMRGILFLSFALLALPALDAEVIVSTSLSLTNLQITPDSGSAEILGGVVASANAQVLADPFGNTPFDIESTVDGATSANAATAYANASATASAPVLTASALSGVNLPGLDGFASTDGNSELSGYFQFSNGGLSDPVNVSFSAALALDQSLMTDLAGNSAYSEANFQFILPDDDANGNFIGTLLALDNPISIGPDSSVDAISSPTLSNSALLTPDTPYYFFLELDSESQGVDSTPEPSTIWLGVAGLAAFVLWRRRGIACS
jgi:MYXO-CTERM domain-containing protein